MAAEAMRCGSIHIVGEHVYRCIMETREEDGHTEHFYNYYRKATAAELQRIAEIEAKHAARLPKQP
jgi:hypothetical protein